MAINSIIEYPLVAVIIVNWNGLDYTTQCLRSVLELSYPNLRVIVVDNGSQIDETIALRKRFISRILTLRVNVNRGFSAGINYGIRYAISNLPDVKYLLISNNDVTFERDFLHKLITVMEKNPKIGIATGKIKVMGRKDILFSIGQKWYPRTGLVKNLGFGEKDSQSQIRAREIDIVPGCVFLLKRSVLEVGFMDEDYFLYFEENDYCLRARRAGYKVYLVPDAVAFHKSAVSVNKIKDFAFYSFQRSRLIFIIKNVESINLILAFFLNMMYILIFGLRTTLGRKDSLYLYLCIKAIIENIFSFKRVYHRRSFVIQV